jgi:hypothetical protein
MTFKIQPTLELMGAKTGSLVDLTEAEVSYMLCFKPNATHLDDPDKVKHLWSFHVEGRPHSVWSYKDSHKQQRWSTHGSDELFQLVFGDHYIPSRKPSAAVG